MYSPSTADSSYPTGTKRYLMANYEYSIAGAFGPPSQEAIAAMDELWLANNFMTVYFDMQKLINREPLTCRVDSSQYPEWNGLYECVWI
jgi:hypothetical protein